MIKKNFTAFMTALTMVAVMGDFAVNGATVLAAAVEARGITSVMTPGGIASLGSGLASIAIYGNNASSNLVGKSFNIYKLFDAQNSKYEESINYTFTNECKGALQKIVGEKLGKAPENVTEYEVIDYIQSLNNYKVEGARTPQEENGYYSEFRYFIEKLRDELVKEGNSAADNICVTEVKNDGSVSLTGLDYGYYIIDEVSRTSGEYAASSLCMVDTANPYSVVKIKSDYPSVDKMIQEDDNRDSIGNDGWNDMADYEIGQTVPFKYVSQVPDMNGYHKYYYGWHDVMNEALTFHPDSVAVSLSEGDTTYTLSQSEYKVSENENGDTFTVEIKDLKKIVDAKFDHMDKNGHNTYGQKIVLTYNATLNDKAAEDTGLPGFENKVRLEFSNNPDGTGGGSTSEEKGETGLTPWSCVVCFTYRLNGIKMNDHDLRLEGAKFRLYQDKDCTEEVLVKKTDAGYIVINEDSVTSTTASNAVEMISDRDGVFDIIGLDSGTYFLKETTAPDGYRRILDPIQIDVTAEFADDRNAYIEGDGALGKALTDLKMTADIRQFLDGILNNDAKELVTNLEHGTGNLTVVNKVGSRLPITGSSVTLIMLGVGCLLIVIADVMNRRYCVKKQRD